MQDNEGKCSGAQLQLILPADESLPISVSIPHLELHGLVYRSGGERSQETSQSAAETKVSPVEQGLEQTTEGGGQLAHAD
jgi:hypothetical protein